VECNTATGRRGKRLTGGEHAPWEEERVRILVNDYAGHPFQLQLSRELARCGHTVLHAYFADAQGPKGNLENPNDAAIGLKVVGIRIARKFAHYAVFARRLADVAYGRRLAAQVTEFGPDVVISANTPLDAQRLLLAATHRQGAHFIFWLQDLLSQAVEFVLQKKRLPFAGLVGRYYRRLERRLLLQSDAIVCIASDFRERLVSWGIAAEKISVIENWSPLEEISPLPRDTAFSREYRLSGKFCFMYSGTLGMKHKPELLWELAERFRDRTDVATVVIAQGAGADWLRERASASPATSLVILPFQPYERHAEVLASSDVLLSLLDSDCGGFAVPSKVLAYLCAGRAQLIAAPLENLASKIVCRAGAGVVTAADSHAFLEAASKLLATPDQLREFGTNARNYAEKTFRIERIGNEMLHVIAFAVRGRRKAPTVRVPSRLAVPRPEFERASR
jgi:colanic acid biosynthesis glycosyl transferase WcaI